MKKLIFNKLIVLALITISNACFSQPGPLAIGTINAGDSIVIYYDVIINSPLVPPSTTYIANRGTITADGGINILTDDPDTAPDDSTFTFLNLTALPVTLTNFRAYEIRNDIELSWRVASEINVANYEIEKSSDGRTFISVGNVQARGGIGTLSYSFLDLNPFTGDNFYRLRIVDFDTRFKYSMIVKVIVGKDGQVFVVYPNPAKNKIINVQLTNFAKGRYEFNLYNSVGQIIYRRFINHAGGSASEMIVLPSTISSGIYHANFKGNATLISRKLMIE